jgi:hypothetical protein
VKYLATFSLLLLFLAGSSAADETYLRDVPEGHYAYDAVYDLINRGVTRGFPDGTFRGRKIISRYEIASFLSKFSTSFDVSRGAGEKLVEELSSEISLLQYQREKTAEENQVAGDFSGRFRRGETPAKSGGKLDYRLITLFTRNFGESSALKVDFDTMDAGFDAGTRDLLREMLDFEGRVKWGRAVLKITSGPGDVVHLDDGLFPSENRMTYRRPWRTASISAAAEKTNLCLKYISRSGYASGWVGTAEISASLAQNISRSKITLNPRIFYDQFGGRDLRLEAVGEFLPANGFYSSLMIGVASASNYPHGLYLMGNLGIGDRLKIIAQRIGNAYRPQFNYGIYDLFDRSLSDGAASVGLEYLQPLFTSWFAKIKYDYTDPNAVQTADLSIAYNFIENGNIALNYQSYWNQSHSALVGAGVYCRI